MCGVGTWMARWRERMRGEGVKDECHVLRREGRVLVGAMDGTVGVA